MIKSILAAMLLLFGLGLSAGCSGDGGSTNTVNGLCQAGQVLVNGNQCLNQLGCPAGQGWNGQSCIQGTVVTPGSIYGGNVLTFSNSLQIFSRVEFENFLEAMGMCSNDEFTEDYGFYGPNPESCRTYSQSGYVTIQFYPSESQNTADGNVPAFVIVGAGSPTATAQTFGGMYQNHLTVPVNMKTFVVNNNTGFELFAHGMFTAGISAEVRMRTETGNYMTDSNFETVLRFNDKIFAKTFVNKHF